MYPVDGNMNTGSDVMAEWIIQNPQNEKKKFNVFLGIKK